jgi:hypothetical protein
MLAWPPCLIARAARPEREGERRCRRSRHPRRVTPTRQRRAISGLEMVFNSAGYLPTLHHWVGRWHAGT